MGVKTPFDGVYKYGGVYASVATDSTNKGWVGVMETANGVTVSIGHMARTMTIAEARSFAAQIMEQARRHEVRYQP